MCMYMLHQCVICTNYVFSFTYVTGVFFYVRMYVYTYVLHKPLSLLDSVATYYACLHQPANKCMYIPDIRTYVYSFSCLSRTCTTFLRCIDAMHVGKPDIPPMYVCTYIPMCMLDCFSLLVTLGSLQSSLSVHCVSH